MDNEPVVHRLNLIIVLLIAILLLRLVALLPPELLSIGGILLLFCFPVLLIAAIRLLP